MATMSVELPQFVRDLLASPPKRGDGLNNWFFRIARVLHPYRSAEQIEQLLQAATAGQPLQRAEIRRAIERSKASAWDGARSTLAPLPPRSWPSANEEQREAVTARGAGLVDLWEASPIRDAHPEEILDALFPGNPLLCIGQDNSHFATRPREEWRGQACGMQLIVPSPMASKTGKTQDGRESQHTLESTGPRRFLVLEFDSGTADEHAALLLHLGESAPLALAVHSGGKSLHGWFYCHGKTEGLLRRFMERGVTLGADRATWTRSQFVRMPGGRRSNGKEQSVYFFNPGVIK